MHEDLKLPRGLWPTPARIKLGTVVVSLHPTSRQRCEVCVVASTITPSGRRLAGKYGLGMLCVAATSVAYDVLAPTCCRRTRPSWGGHKR